MKRLVWVVLALALCVAPGVGAAQEEEVVTEAPKGPDVDALRAEADKQAQKGRYRKAVELYKEVLRLRPSDYPGIYYNVAEMSRALEDHNEVAIYFARYLELDPNASDRAAIERAITQARKRRGPGGAAVVTISGPAQALLLLDGVPICERLTCELDLAPGEYRFRAQAADFEPQEGAVTVRAGERRELALALKAIPYYGGLKVALNVEGAQVFVDGQAVEAGAAEPLRLPVGKHFVEVKKEGYHPWVRNVTLERDARLDLDVKLSPIKTAEP
jgi:tetratricopeptide (TPR) repeat protein